MAIEASITFPAGLRTAQFFLRRSSLSVFYPPFPPATPLSLPFFLPLIFIFCVSPKASLRFRPVFVLRQGSSTTISSHLFWILRHHAAFYASFFRPGFLSLRFFFSLLSACRWHPANPISSLDIKVDSSIAGARACVRSSRGISEFLEIPNRSPLSLSLSCFSQSRCRYTRPSLLAQNRRIDSVQPCLVVKSFVFECFGHVQG